jgi:nitrile hydratase
VPPEDVEVRVHDSTADIRYLVLPLRPRATERLSEDELAKLVTRDSMIGVMDALPALPTA